MGIDRTLDVLSDGFVFWLCMSNVDGGADAGELEEFWCEVFVHAQAAMRAGIGFHPAGVEAVSCSKFCPVGHGCADFTGAGRSSFLFAP